ncbi:MAG: NAD(P)-dependent oxidoreductase, partial [Planctomycetota bacterium]
FGEVTILSDASAMPIAEQLERIRSCDVLLTGWGTTPIPREIASDPGRLRYVCNITGGLKGWVPIELIQANIPVTNWGDAPAFHVAEGSLTLLLACLKNLGGHMAEKRTGGWSNTWTGPAVQCGSLRGLRVGLYGLGVIGRKFAEQLLPFGAVVSAFDPYAKDWPPSIRKVDTLQELFATAEAISLHAGVNDSTTHSVTADLLRQLPDHGIVINTARGVIIDQPALFAELASGRLRAGLDVLDDGDSLPPEHPARQWPNLILTSHAVGGSSWPIHPENPESPLQIHHEICIDNLGRFARGEPPRFRISAEQYQLMT